MKTTRIAGGLAVVVLGLGPSGCGTGSSSTHRTTGSGTPPTATPGLKRSELIAEANAICAQATVKAPPLKAPGRASSAATAAELDRVLPLYDRQVKEFQALVPAADVARDWQAVVAAEVTVDQLLAGFKRELVSNHPISPVDRTKFGPAVRGFIAAAAKLGLTCTSG